MVEVEVVFVVEISVPVAAEDLCSHDFQVILHVEYPVKCTYKILILGIMQYANQLPEIREVVLLQVSFQLVGPSASVP